MTPRTTPTKTLTLLSNFAVVSIFSVCLTVSELAQAKIVTPVFSPNLNTKSQSLAFSKLRCT